MNPFTKAGTLVQENSNSAFETSRRLNAITQGYGSREYLINRAITQYNTVGTSQDVY